MVHLRKSHTPGIHDVICQRGKKAFTHIGNRRLRFLVNANRSKYFDSINNKASRSAIVTNIIDSIRKNGGRFVRLDTKRKLWLEVSDRISREKVGHALRHTTEMRASHSKSAVGSKGLVQQHDNERERNPIAEVVWSSSQQRGPKLVTTLSDTSTTLHEFKNSEDFIDFPPEHEAKYIDLSTNTLELQPLPLHSSFGFDEEAIAFLSELCSDLEEEENDENDEASPLVLQ